MTRLLSADFARLRRSPVFWLGGAAMLAYGVWNVLEHWNLERQYGGGPGLEGAVFGFLILLVYVQSIVCVVFIHDDHRYGGIRNKLAVGRSRAAVFISHLAVQYLTALIYSGLYLLAVFGLGLPLLGAPGVPAWALLEGLFCALWVELAVTVLLTVLALLAPHRSVLAAGLLSVFALMLACAWMDSQLSTPETIDNYGGAVFITHEDGSVTRQFVDTDGNVILPEEIEQIPNPNYVHEPLRGLYGLCLDLCPVGQVIQLSGTTDRQSEPWVLGVSAAGVALTAGALGMVRFWGMDIK